MPTKKANTTTTTKKKKNPYQQKAKKKSIMEGFKNPDATKGNLQSTLALTGITVLVALGGGFAGAALGKPSLLVGAGVTGAGHYTGNRLATMFGLSMMASGGFLSGNKSVNGIKGLDGAKERITQFKDELKQKLYLDKIKKKKPDEAKKTVGEMGAVQYLNYPELAAYYNNNANLDVIEAQISGPAELFAGEYEAGVSGYAADISEMNL